MLGEVIKFFAFTFRMSCEIENNFTSAQRLYRYTELESEDLLIKPLDQELNAGGKVWPNDGKIELIDVTMRYRKTLEPSLNNLSMCI